MIYIEPHGTNAALHFATEEYIMLSDNFIQPVFMIWQADNCTMLGVNQISEAEVNMPKAEARGVQIVRRQSGGGTIYTDMGSLLYTFILPYNNELSPIEILRKSVAAPVITALHKLGIPAELIGRNDILVEGKKISGLAQYAKNGKILTHGSLLYNTNLDTLTELITANPEKFESKALSSVRSRVGNISDYIAPNHNGDKPTTAEFWSLFKQALLQDNFAEYILSNSDTTAIESLCADKYANNSWTFGRTPDFTYKNRRHCGGGFLEVFFNVQNGNISTCSIHGDFLGILPISELEVKLKNQPFNPTAISAAINKAPLTAYLGSITIEEFLACIFN